MTESTATKPEGTPDIRIESLNSDKTRQSDDSGNVYNVYFQLSAAPGAAWARTFEQVWHSLSEASAERYPEAAIDRAFLTIQCALPKIDAVYLPRLIEAVARTNEAYKQLLIQSDQEQQQREDVWSKERSKVEAIADSLHFDGQTPK